MNLINTKSKITRLSSIAVVFGMLFLSSFLTAYGQTTTFAQFFERTGSQDFVFTNNTTSASFSAVGGGSPIFFIYSNIANLDASLTGIQSAHLFVTTTTNQSASTVGTNFTQPLNQITTVQIIRDTPTPIGVGHSARTNLLTAVFSTAGNTPGIVGSIGGSSATLSATTPGHLVSFTSDFLLFGATIERNMAFSFSSVAPTLALGSGNFLQSWTAAASGTFASNPPPTIFLVTAASVSLSGRVLTSKGSGLRNAQVLLTDMNGRVRTVVSNAFGNFMFDGLESGQSYVVSVKSKQFTFSPKFVSLGDNLSGLELTADF